MKPDLDAIRARCDAATSGPWHVIEEGFGSYDSPRRVLLEAENGQRIFWDCDLQGPHSRNQDAEFIAHARTDIPALLAYVDELEREIAILRPWSVMLKRAHGALTDAGCVVPLEFDKSIEHAIKDLARRATRAEQLCVDEYDARRDVERQRDELLRVNKGAAQHGIITEHVRELIELLGIQLQNPTANEAVDAAANEIKTLRTTVEELKARIVVLEAMKP